MIGTIGMGIGAGLVSALLVGVVATGSFLAFLLFFLAPLPIVIAALGWNHRVGLVATFVGAAALAASIHPLTGLFYAIGTGLPAWWLAYLALLARPGPDGAAQWYPLGRLLYWIAVMAGGLTVAGILSLGFDYETYIRAFERAVDLILRLNPRLLDQVPEAARANARRDLAAFAAALAPPLTAGFSVCVTAFVLWAGAKSVAKSGRLPRPWPALPDLALPREALIGLALALPFALLDGFPGLSARTMLAAFVAAFGLQGIAIIHKFTIGMNGRGGVLFALYAMLVVFSGWPLIVLAVGGVADHFLDLRSRAARRGPPPSLPPTDPKDQRRNPWK